jgi:hypothetical protein
MKEAAKVVRKTVGRTTINATPSMNTVKSRAATTAIRRAAMSEKRNTVREKVKKSRSGIPVNAIWAVRKAWHNGQ